MEPRFVSSMGYVQKQVFDTRLNFEYYNYIERYDAVADTFNLYNVQSDKTKPYPRNKPQTYSIEKLVYGQGSATSSEESPDGRWGVNLTGVVGSGPTMVPIGSPNNAYNTALSKLAEVVRGRIDLSIDAFQHRRTVKLVRNILNARKRVAEMALYVLTLSTYPVVKAKDSKRVKPPPKGSRAYYLWKYNKTLPRKRSQEEYFNNIFRRPMKDVGSLWLQFTYGLKPTLQTIHDLINRENVRVGNSLNVHTKNRDGKVSKHASASLQYESLKVSNRPPAAGWTLTDKTRSRYVTQIGGSYLPGSSFVEGMSRITSLNPASIGWELLPLSFVIDWFYDIGGYLRNMETALLSNMLGKFSGFVTNLGIHNFTRVAVGNGLNKINGVTYGGSWSASGKSVTKKRVVLTTFPLPRPARFRADLSSGRMLNAAALLTVLLDRKK